MMKDKFFCPKCGKEKHPHCASLIHFIKRLDMPYFMCGDCRVLCYYKMTIRECVVQLRKNDSWARSVPFKVLYKRAIEYMDKIVWHDIKELGYRFAYFKKQ